MKKIIALMLIISILLVGCMPGNKGKNVDQKSSATKKTDTKEDNKIVDAKGKKVIAGTAAVAEYLDALNEKFVGVAEQNTVPAKYKDVPRIGLPMKVNAEVISGLKADLFIGDIVLRDATEKVLSAIKVDSVYLDNNSYDSVFESINRLGKMFGKEKEAKAIVEKLRARETEILKKAEPLKGKKAIVLFGTGESYLLATENSFIGNLLEKAGVENLAKGVSKTPSPYVKFSLEEIIAKNPDYILTLSHGRKEQAKKMFVKEMKKDIWKDTKAVKEGKVLPLDDNDYPVTGTIHVVEILENLINLLNK